MNSLWGVLVSCDPPTVSNGLLPYLRSQRRVLRRVAPAAAEKEEGEGGNRSQGPQQQLVSLLHKSSGIVSSATHGQLASLFLLPADWHSSGGGGSNGKAGNDDNNSDEDDGEDDVELGASDPVRHLTALLPLAGDCVRVGRQRINDISLPTNPCLSNLHCTLVATAEANTVHDGGNSGGGGDNTSNNGALPSDGRGGVVDGAKSPGCTLDALLAGLAPPPPPPAQQQQQQQQRLRVLLTDTSTNGCLVNGSRFGRGRTCRRSLQDGDTVELMNAGKRHTSEFNLKFVFYHINSNAAATAAAATTVAENGTNDSTAAAADGNSNGGSPSFPSWLRAQAAQRLTISAATAQQHAVATSPSQQQQRERRARRRALLLRARWTARAQVDRMYGCDVEDFYRLCGGPLGLLGEGAFGKVYRAALRPPTEVAQLEEEQQQQHDQYAVEGEQQQQRQLDSTATAAPMASEVLSWAATAAEGAAALERRKAAYVAARSREPPRDAAQVQAAAAAAATAGRTTTALSSSGANGDGGESKKHRTEEEPTATISAPVIAGDDVAAFPFAVKIINKKRMLLEALDDNTIKDDGEAATTTTTSANPSNSDINNYGGSGGGGAMRVQLAGMREPMTVSPEERALLKNLVALETQPEDHARRRERDWASAEARQAIEAAAGLSQSQPQQQPLLLGGGGGGVLIGGSQPLFSNKHNSGSGSGGGGTSLQQQQQPPSLFTPETCGGVGGESLSLHLTPTPTTTTTTTGHGNDSNNEVPLTQREQLRSVAKAAARQELMSHLNPTLRKQYERELQQLRRLQCEVNILLSVQHRNITRLHEVFDSPGRLSLVMEQALGGEAWDLLQPSKRLTTASPRHMDNHNDHDNVAVGDGVNSVNRGEVIDQSDEDELSGLYTGGALPEFLVKIIIVQVLEAVHHLHAKGIAHRDLKLENLLLQRPCRAQALGAAQLEMLAGKIRQYWTSNNSSDSATSPGQGTTEHNATATTTTTTTAATTTVAAAAAASPQLMLNPLSPLYTVHLPRALWPVIKVSDFGLSWMLEQSGRNNTSGNNINNAGKPSYIASDRDGANATTPLLYTRNDMTTGCGTPIYAAPEVTDPSLRADRTGYSAAVDLFSIGVITFALLTGRIPFPKRESPGRPPVFDYAAPLQFTRARKRGKGSATTANNNTTVMNSYGVSAPVAPQEEILPPIAMADSFRIPCAQQPEENRPMPAGLKRTRAGGDNENEANSTRGGWWKDMDSVAARVALVESRKHQQQQQEVPTNAEPVIFPATMQATVRAIEAYAAQRQREGREVDIESFFKASAAHASNTSTAAATATTAAAADPRMVELPPISPLGQHFLQGLLRRYPTQRMTAWQALEHPWLRDCRAEEDVEE